LWGGKVDDGDKGWHIAQAASRAGLAFPPLQSAMAADHARFDAKLTEMIESCMPPDIGACPP